MVWLTLHNFSNAKQRSNIMEIFTETVIDSDVTTFQILMPEGTVPARAERIRKLGAECDVLDVRNITLRFVLEMDDNLRFLGEL